MGRRALLLILTPVLVVILLSALAVGIFQAADINLANLVSAFFGQTEAADRLATVVGWLAVPLRILVAAALFFGAWIVSRFSWRIAGRLLDTPVYRDLSRPRDAAPQPIDPTEPQPAPAEQPPTETGGRRATLHHLLASLISFSAYLVAFVLAAGQFFSIANLAIVSTILANAFGFAARDFIGDLISGITNIFEDRFDVGERVNIVRVGDTIEGVVEKVTVRTVSLRTRTGELIIVPQGDMRMMRNYSRGSFTGIKVMVSVRPQDLPRAMELLQALGEEGPTLLEDLIEPWRVYSREGEMRSAAELVLYARAAYGHGADLRLQIMALIQQQFAAAGIEFAG